MWTKSEALRELIELTGFVGNHFSIIKHISLTRFNASSIDYCGDSNQSPSILAKFNNDSAGKMYSSPRFNVCEPQSSERVRR